MIDNALSDQFTVIEVAGLDRPGLLYELTNALSDLILDITSAHITTFGEKAVDVFYVTDLTGKKVANPARQKAIRERLLEVLGTDWMADARRVEHARAQSRLQPDSHDLGAIAPHLRGPCTSSASACSASSLFS